LWSDLFPGNQTTVKCLQPAVLGVETSLDLRPEQRKRTIFRLDGGAGTDGNLKWLLHRDYHVIAKGYSGKRAYALAHHVERWDAYHPICWLGWVPASIDFGRPVQVMVKKWLHKNEWKHSYYVTTLPFSSKQAFMARYDLRGGAEIEQFRADKSGLFLSSRRKQSFEAQKALVLLTDLAHNLLADFHHRALADSRFANWGLKRIVRDLLTIPARLRFRQSQLYRIDLLSSHPYSEELLICLEKYWSTPFDE
jgi:hypothetical protein